MRVDLNLQPCILHPCGSSKNIIIGLGSRVSGLSDLGPYNDSAFRVVHLCNNPGLELKQVAREQVFVYCRLRLPATAQPLSLDGNDNRHTNDTNSNDSNNYCKHSALEFKIWVVWVRIVGDKAQTETLVSGLGYPAHGTPPIACEACHCQETLKS